MKILAIHAHPDDVDILAGGTLSLLSDRGHDITIATMTAGDCGSRTIPPDELARMRQAEAAAAAKLVNAKYIWVGFGDLNVFNDDQSRRRTTECIRQVQPEIVITASPADYHCDHEATSVLVRDACFAAGAPNYHTGPSPIVEHIPHLYFMDPVDGVDRDCRPVEPAFVVDVEAKMDLKRAMFACHESQRLWLRAQHGIDDWMKEMETWSAHIGARHGLRYAEGFRQYRCHPFPRTDLLGDLLFR